MTSRPYVDTLVFLGGISVDVRAWVTEQPDGDNPVTWGIEGSLGPGGRAAVAAAGAVKLGRRFVDLVGCVGDDLLGDSIVHSLKDSGVSVRLVDRVKGTATGLQQVAIDSKGDRRMVGVPAANWHTGEAQVRRADSTIFGADLLFATLEVPLDTVSRVVSVACSRGVPVLLNATPIPTPSGEDVLDDSLLRNVDVLLTNWSAAQRMAEMPDASGPVGLELGRRLLKLGPKAVVITLGEHGSMVAVRGKHALVEPVAAHAVDTTGAGDAYAAALAVGLTAQSRGNYRWEYLLQAARFASAAAAASVTRVGGLASLPDRDEVERLMTAQSHSVDAKRALANG